MLEYGALCWLQHLQRAAQIGHRAQHTQQLLLLSPAIHEHTASLLPARPCLRMLLLRLGGSSTAG